MPQLLIYLFSGVDYYTQVIIKECHNEEAQCSFVIDKILETISNCSAINCTYGDVAILYRRQVEAPSLSLYI